MIDGGLRDCFLDATGTLSRLRAREDRSRNGNDFPTHNRPWHFDVNININIALEPEPLNRLLGAAPQLIVVRSLVNDNRVVISDIRDVGGLIDNRDVAFDRNHYALDLLRTEFICRNETILVRARVIIIVRPIMNARPPVKARFRREWRPADVIVTLAP